MDEIVVRLHAVDWIIVCLYIAGMLWVGYFFKNPRGSMIIWPVEILPPLAGSYPGIHLYGLDTCRRFGVLAFEGISSFYFYASPFTAFILPWLLAPKFKEKFPKDSTMQDIVFKSYGKPPIFASIAAFLYSNNSQNDGHGFPAAPAYRMPIWLGI